MTDTATTTELPPVATPTSGVRDALGEVRDLDEGKREVLVSIPWEVIDTYRSDFSRDCFDDYLGGNKPVICWQHNKAEPIGRVQEWQKGQRANEFVGRFSDFEAVPRARQAFAQVRDGDITDFSFYYDQAQAIAHPNVRGAIRFTRARMPEISPVTVGSIPGAKAVGVRAAADHAGLAELVRSNVLTEDEARAMLGLDGPAPKPAGRERVVIPAGTRAMTITIGDDGSGTEVVAGDQTGTTGMTGQPAAPGQIVAAVDAALDSATALLDGVDRSQLPTEVQQALALVDAAAIGADEAMDALGITDPDDTDDAGGARSDELDPETQASLDQALAGERASDKPYGDVEYADPGYQDDGKNRYPVDTEEHVRAAWSYVNQESNASKYSAENLAKVKANIKAAAKKLGVSIIDDEGSRSADDTDLEVLAAQARATLLKHR